MPRIKENLAKSYQQADSFNRRFWQTTSAQERFMAAWLMVQEYWKIKGKHGNKLRLRRSVQNIERL